MRVLLDHNLPHKLRASLMSISEDEIVTASFKGWGHLQNGHLLQVAEDDGFDILVTGDRTMIHEQNLDGRRLAVVALSVTNWPILRERVPRILEALRNATPGSFQSVDCGSFSRKQ